MDIFFIWLNPNTQNFLESGVVACTVSKKVRNTCLLPIKVLYKTLE